MSKLFSKYQKRNSSVEILRTIGCLIVISVHIKLPLTDANGSADLSRYLISCFLADGVAVFWMISGFYMNREIVSYGKHLKNVFFKICLPTLLYFLVYIAYAYLADGVRVTDTVKLLCTDLSLWGTFSGQAPTLHLWYIYTYIAIALIQPLIQKCIALLDEKNAWKFFLPAVMLLLVWNDVKNNALLEFSHHAVNALVPSVLVILTGYFIYKTVSKNCIAVWAPLLTFAVFISVNLIRCRIGFSEYEKSGSIHILFWYSAPGVMSAGSLAAFVLCLFKKMKNSAVINFMASQTFYVYLIHVLVITYTQKIGLYDRILNALTSALRGIAGEAAFTAVYACFVFAVSFVIAAVANGLKDLILLPLKGRSGESK